MSLATQNPHIVSSRTQALEAVKVFIFKRHFMRGIPASGRLRQCALNVPVTEKHRRFAPIPPYKIR